METKIKEQILKVTSATDIEDVYDIQSLWAGHGVIQRVYLRGGKHASVILKNINTLGKGKSPSGRDTDYSFKRKMKSYKIEICWYQNFNQNNIKDQFSYTPTCLASYNENNKMFLILEDLDANGYPVRLYNTNFYEIDLGIKWLAHFHAKHLSVEAKGLWKVGTYWHLATRPDEFKKIKGTNLYKWSHKIDSKLNNTPFKTIVHGDAKLANFCFSKERDKVSAVDFQYVGGGCGMKDLAYFIGSCLDEKDSEVMEEDLLHTYFQELKYALDLNKKGVDFDALEKNWRDLFPYAWSDFYRFLMGWSPGYCKINSYSSRVLEKVIKDLENNK